MINFCLLDHLICGDDEQLLDVLGNFEAGLEAHPDAEVHQLKLLEPRSVCKLADVLRRCATLQSQPLQPGQV